MTKEAKLTVIVSTGDPAQDLRDLADTIGNGISVSKEKIVAILLHASDLVEELRAEIPATKSLSNPSCYRVRFPNKEKPICESYLS